MKTIVLLCLVAAAFAAPPASGREAQIVKFSQDISPEGSYSWEFAQDDGLSAQARGDWHPGTGKDNEGAVAVTGTFSWVGADGVTYTGTYTADENGYKPHFTQGQGGAIPDEIIKAFSRK